MIDQFKIRQPDYLKYFEAFRDSTSLQQIATKVQEQIAKKGDTLRCMDSMAGTGIVGQKMKETFVNIDMVYQDKSPLMLDSDAYHDEERVESDAAKMTFPDNSFDVIFCRGGLNNVGKEDYPTILKEYLRVLSEDGIAIIQDHFTQTEEEKNVVNEIETEIANLEGREDETYVPTIDELKQLIEKSGGTTTDSQSFNIRLSLKKRFEAKGIENPDFSNIKTILEGQIHLEYEELDDDIVVTYPVYTVTLEKKSESESKKVEDEKAVQKGWQYLESESKRGAFSTYIGSSRHVVGPKETPKEVFTSIVIADTLPAHPQHSELKNDILHYIEEQSQQGNLSFFENRSLIAPDTDTNSFGYSVLLENGLTTPEQASGILDTILKHADDEGKMQVWLSDEKENRLDHVAAVNAVYLAHLIGREVETQTTEKWIIAMLESGKYLEGSRYYHSPDFFLYFASRLMKFPESQAILKPLLEEQLRARIGKTNDPLDLAMRSILADTLGIDNEQEKNALRSMQEQDGAWPTDALYREGTKPRYYVNKSLPTAFAMKALSTK